MQTVELIVKKRKEILESLDKWDRDFTENVDRVVDDLVELSIQNILQNVLLHLDSVCRSSQFFSVQLSLSFLSLMKRPETEQIFSHCLPFKEWMALVKSWSCDDLPAPYFWKKESLFRNKMLDCLKKRILEINRPGIVEISCSPVFNKQEEEELDRYTVFVTVL